MELLSVEADDISEASGSLNWWCQSNEPLEPDINDRGNRGRLSLVGHALPSATELAQTQQAHAQHQNKKDGRLFGFWHVPALQFLRRV